MVTLQPVHLSFQGLSSGSRHLKTWLQTASFAPRCGEELTVEATALREAHLKFLCRNCFEPCKPRLMLKTKVTSEQENNTNIPIQRNGSSMNLYNSILLYVLFVALHMPLSPAGMTAPRVGRCGSNALVSCSLRGSLRSSATQPLRSLQYLHQKRTTTRTVHHGLTKAFERSRFDA